ncbi:MULTISPECIES: alpha/beta hydrolase [unclassified Enterococcus]|uniref:alpha/beta hydrolase n=1 Tax=unclassified Enterococcus TaxID=2608891 RepID=UPI003D2AF757
MKIWMKIVIGLVIILSIGLIWAGNYFYNYAVVPSKKDFLENDTPGTHQEANSSEEKQWFTNEKNRSYWTQTSDDQLKLSAIYLPAEKETHQTAIVAHGYMGNAETMSSYAKMFHDMGYNVLVPDARGHGKSEGDYIGFGWHERKDYVRWIDQVLAKNGSSEKIVLYGVSMGAATVMMTSGEKLPTNVKAIIEDCGYSSVTDELTYQLGDMFNLPAFPLIPMTSLITKLKAGYFFGEADAVKQLHKNKTPMLFIHGDADTFVPFSMLEKVYNATDAPKEKYVVHGAEHAKAFRADEKKYKETVQNFLEKYVKN